MGTASLVQSIGLPPCGLGLAALHPNETNEINEMNEIDVLVCALYPWTHEPDQTLFQTGPRYFSSDNFARAALA